MNKRQTWATIIGIMGVIQMALLTFDIESVLLFSINAALLVGIGMVLFEENTK